MKKISISIFCLIILFPSFINAQNTTDKGCVKESLSVRSAILGREIKYSVYLPSDYFTSNRLYPVLYLLHGSTDDETSWIQFGEVQISADKLIASRESAPLIIIMPDAGLTWYINNFNNSVPYEDAFIREFIPLMEKTYRIRSNKEFRAVGGLSMGGYGSLLYAFKHTEMFVACLPFSAGIWNDSLMMRQLKIGGKYTVDCFGNLRGDTLPENWKRNSLLDLASSISTEKLSSVKYYIDCGDKDPLIFGNTLLNLILNDRKVPHEFRIRDGNHEWNYWRKSIVDGLKYLSPIFSR